jgi:ubiquinone/menaquinone biosynthesis C-methylase UbiE
MDKMTIHGENVEFWDKIANRYDWFTLRFIRGYASLIRRILDDLSDTERILEVAAGTGLIAIELAKRAGWVEAIDFSSRMIEIAKSKAIENDVENVHFSVQSAYNLGFEDGEFDAAVCSNALHCMNVPERALSEILRVLKVNGILIAPTFCHGVNWRSRLLSRIMSLTGFKSYHRFSIEEFLSLIVRNGFTIKRTDLSKNLIPLAYVIAQRKEDIVNSLE